MGQAEVLKVLENNKWMTSKQIAKELNQRAGLVSRSLNSLLKQKEVKRKREKKENYFMYLWKKW